MPTLTRKPRSRTATSVNRVKQLLAELTYRLHVTKVVGTKPSAQSADQR